MSEKSIRLPAVPQFPDATFTVFEYKNFKGEAAWYLQTQVILDGNRIQITDELPNDIRNAQLRAIDRLIERGGL